MGLSFDISANPSTGVTQIRLGGSLSVRTSKRLADYLSATAVEGEHVLLDLSDLTELDFAGLAVIAGSSQRHSQLGAKLQVLAPETEALHLIHSARLQRRIDVYRSRADVGTPIPSAAPATG